MTAKTIILNELSVEQLQQLINTSVKDGIKEFQSGIQTNDNSEELLTRKQTCKFLKIDSSTLWAWTNKKKVNAYGMGARRYYKRSELLECLTLLKK
jgi:hypothetical protein